MEEPVTGPDIGGRESNELSEVELGATESSINSHTVISGDFLLSLDLFD